MVAYAEPGEEEGKEAGGSIAAEGAGDEGGADRQGGGAVRRASGRVEMSTSIPIIKRLRLYPAALVVCWSWATINRVREVFMPYEASMFWLFVLQYGFQVSLDVCFCPAVRPPGPSWRCWRLALCASLDCSNKAVVVSIARVQEDLRAHRCVCWLCVVFVLYRACCDVLVYAVSPKRAERSR